MDSRLVAAVSAKRLTGAPFSGVRDNHEDCRLPPEIFSQVPFGTYTKSVATRSFVAVPAQECPLAQSFLPAFATPKHFSNVEPGSGTGPAALAGAAMANATAAASAGAVRLEVKKAFFMMNPHLVVIGEDGTLHPER